MLGFIGKWASSKGMGRVPDLEGLSLNEARTAITNAGFNLGNETSRGNNDGANSSNNGKAKRREDTDSLLDYESIIDFEYYSYVEPVVTPVVVTPVVVTPVVVTPVVVTPVVVTPVVVTPVVVTPVVVTPSEGPASTCIPNSASMSSPGWTPIGCGDNGYCDGTAYYERGTCDYYQDYNGTRYYASCSSNYSGPYYQDGSCGYVTPVVTPVVVTPVVVTPVVVTPACDYVDGPTYCLNVDSQGYGDLYQRSWTAGCPDVSLGRSFCGVPVVNPVVNPVVVTPEVVNPVVVNPVVVTPEVVSPVVVSPVVVTPSCGGTVQLEIYPGAGIYVTCFIQPDCSVEC
jgi:hypothetical protein